MVSVASLQRRAEISPAKIELELALGPILASLLVEHVGIVAAAGTASARGDALAVELEPGDVVAAALVGVEGDEGFGRDVPTRGVDILHEPVEGGDIAFARDGGGVHHRAVGVAPARLGFRAYEPSARAR